jgi:hypothetical protein
LNDLISNVLARSVGSLPTIQPRLPSIFEPYRAVNAPLSMHANTAFETASEVEHVAVPGFPEAPQPHSQRLMPATEHRKAVHDSVSPGLPPTSGSYDWQQSHQPSQDYSTKLRATSVETTDESSEPMQPIHRTLRDDETVRVVQTKRIIAVEADESSQSHITARIAEHAASANLSPAHPDRIAVPTRHQRASADGFDRALRITNNPSEPVIQVTIGRVEVRAIFPEHSRPAPRVPSRPTLSLDNYLQKRSGSGR